MLNVLRLLVPVDFSKESDLALEWAVLVARKNPGATIYLLHVLPPRAEGMGAVAFKSEQEAIEAKFRVMQESVQPPTVCYTLIEKGHIPEVIAKLVEQKDIDLLVMTTRGRQGLKHFLPDSTTEHTIRVASCPVLVLHHNIKNRMEARA